MRKTKIKLIRIGMSTSDIASGAADTHHALQNYIQHRGLDIPILQTGSLGACHREPLVEIVTDEQSYLYGPITAERVRPILNQHLGSGERGISPEWVVSQYSDRRDYPFLQKQVRVTTQLCGLINPFSLDDYLAHDGYKAWERALTLAPSEVVEMVKASKLRGRGGAGYPTGNKWGYIASKNITPKYFICNADEGDPGAFMDRAMIEGDPHRLLEGMLIAGYATGATRGYIYIRAEYPLAVRALRHAIRQIEERGLLGPNAFGQGKPYDIIIKEGAGAFVCGEETALMHSIEGLRGVPSMRPPYPAERGLWGYPSNINNVETLCSIPTILLKGPEWFASIGTAKSGGTKAFALAGSIRKSGLVEVPLGTSLHELIFDMAGGCADGHTLKGIQLGGPSGGCIPAHLLDLPIDYEELSATGAIMGSGGMIAIDDTTSMVAFARYFLNFTQEESCGKCVPCRVGTRKMLNILDKILAHKATSADLDRLRGLCHTVGKASLCGLGQTAPNPVLTTLRYFEEEYLALLN
ncbi:MAG: NADH-quinone oxidoreductase subunit F [Chloroflexi bacterium]|nr:NADH-quinone oxidoreductase subunit F [Chloroflexota bacterium]